MAAAALLIVLLIIPGYLYILLNHSQKFKYKNENGQNIYFQSIIIGLIFFIFSSILEYFPIRLGLKQLTINHIQNLFLVSNSSGFNTALYVYLVLKSCILVFVYNEFTFYLRSASILPKLIFKKEYIDKFFYIDVSTQKAKFKNFKKFMEFGFLEYFNLLSNQDLHKVFYLNLDLDILKNSHLDQINNMLMTSAYFNKEIILHMDDRKYYIGKVPLIMETGFNSDSSLKNNNTFSNSNKEEENDEEYKEIKSEILNKMKWSFLSSMILIWFSTIMMISLFLSLLLFFLIGLEINFSNILSFCIVFFVIYTSYMTSKGVGQGKLFQSILNEKDEVTIIPRYSGHRDKDTLRINPDVDYGEGNKDPIILTLRKSNIVSISIYNHNKFLELKEQTKFLNIEKPA